MTIQIDTKANRTARCSACGNNQPCTQQQSYPDNGWVLPLDAFGYYGGFDDNISGLETFQTRGREWIFCHDCVVKFLTLFPRLQVALAKGLHPCENETPCCEWAWRSTDLFGKYEENSSGELIPASGAHYQIVKDGVWQDA